MPRNVLLPCSGSNPCLGMSYSPAQGVVLALKCSTPIHFIELSCMTAAGSNPCLGMCYSPAQGVVLA